MNILCSPRFETLNYFLQIYRPRIIIDKAHVVKIAHVSQIAYFYDQLIFINSFFFIDDRVIFV